MCESYSEIGHFDSQFNRTFEEPFNYPQSDLWELILFSSPVHLQVSEFGLRTHAHEGVADILQDLEFILEREGGMVFDLINGPEEEI